MDLLLARENLLPAVERLASLGFRRAGTPMSVAGGRLEIQRLIKIDGSDLVPVDLLIPNDPALAALLAGREAVAWEGGRLSIVSLPGLRALCLRLPHVPTPAEAARVRRCEALAVSPESATRADVEALATGWRRWWHLGDTERLRAMAARVPAGLINTDRRLALYACASGALQGR